MSDMKSKQIATETKQDACLQRVIEHLNDGWPRSEFQRFYNINGVVEFILFPGVCVSSNLQMAMCEPFCLHHFLF